MYAEPSQPSDPWTPTSSDLLARIEAHPFDPGDMLGFTRRLARDHGWSSSFARRAVREYGRFCFLAVATPGPVTPSEEVDEVWHLHLTYSRLGRRPPATPDYGPGGLGPLHLGYLSGGAERAAGVALVGLLEAGAAVPDRKRGLIRFDPSTPVAAEFKPFRNVDGREAGCKQFQAGFAFRWQRLHEELTERGLVPDAAAVARWRIEGAALLCAPLLLGACKVAVGASRDRPVGILEILLVLTAVLGVKVLAKRPHRNLAGAAILAAAQRTHARAARAPLPDEVALAFALTGTAVLAGRDYRWVLTSNGPNKGSDGSGDGGGGDGGCGGCSG